MPNKGIAIPVQPIQGRLRISDGEEQMGKIILLALADGDSQNPFAPDYGIDMPVFDVSDGTSRALLRRAVERHFQRWEGGGRAKLNKFFMRGSTDNMGRASRNGDFEIQIEYTDLETDTEHTIVKKYTISGG